MTANRWLTALLIFGMASGCSIFGRSDEPQVGPAADPATIVVTNLHWAPVNVYAVYRGTSTRLGTLSTNQTERFGVPGVFGPSPDISFMIDPIGSTTTYRTPAVFAGPGQEVVLRIENNLELTSLAVH